MFSPKTAIQEIVSWVTQTYLDGHGGVPRGIDEHGNKSRERLFNDLGDYLPFFAFLGQADFCREQLADARRFRRPDGLLPGEFRYAGFECIRSYEHSDYLLGLLDVYEHLLSDGVKHDLLTTAERVHQTFFRSRQPHSWYFPKLHWSFPMTDWKDGMFIELFTLLATTFHEERFKQWAIQLAETIVKQSQDYPLPPDVQGDGWLGRQIVKCRFARAQYHYTPVKYIANTLFGMLELQRTWPEQRWKDYLDLARKTIERDLLNEQGAITAVARKGNAVAHEKILLVHSFPILDWAVDGAYFLHDNQYLTLAKRIADFWLTQQHPITGLMPKEANRTITDHDNLTDMSIALYKLAEVTRETRYHEAARRIIEGVYQFHRDPELNGYAHGVDVVTGEKRERGFKVKFVCLWIKALLAYQTNGIIYGTPHLYGLMKDR